MMMDSPSGDRDDDKKGGVMPDDEDLETQAAPVPGGGDTRRSVRDGGGDTR